MSPTPEEILLLRQAQERGEVKRGETVTFDSDSKITPSPGPEWRWARLRKAWEKQHPNKDFDAYVGTFDAKLNVLTEIENEVIYRAANGVDRPGVSETALEPDPKTVWKSAVVNNTTTSGFAEWLREREEINLPKPGEYWEGNTVIASKFIQGGQSANYYVMLLLSQTTKRGSYYTVVEFIPSTAISNESSYDHIFKAAERYYQRAGGY